MRHVIRNAFVALSLTACSAVYAVTTVPFTFTQGTPAKAAEVNADFQALATAIDTLSARVDKLDGTTSVTMADLAGTYSVQAMYTELRANITGSSYSNVSTQGTLTLAVNGTTTFTGIDQIKTLAGGITVTTSGPYTDNTATWNLSNGKVQIAMCCLLNGNYSIVSGARLLVGAVKNPYGDNAIILMIRN
jgi:hypothetical protein